MTQEDFDGAFTNWWTALDADDKAEFVHEHGGETRHARFACALDLLAAKGEVSTAEAYALASGCSLESAKKNAYGTHGLKHPAVQMLLRRLRHGTRQDHFLELEKGYIDVLKQMVERCKDPEVSRDLLYQTTQALSRWASFVRIDEVEERQARSKRAAEKARANTGLVDQKDITSETAKQLIDLIRDSLGDDVLRQLARKSGEEASDKLPPVQLSRLPREAERVPGTVRTTA